MQGASSMETFFRLLRFPQAFALLFAGQGVNMANLRLSLMDRQAFSGCCASFRICPCCVVNPGVTSSVSLLPWAPRAVACLQGLQRGGLRSVAGAGRRRAVLAAPPDRGRAAEAQDARAQGQVVWCRSGWHA